MAAADEERTLAGVLLVLQRVAAFRLLAVDMVWYSVVTAGPSNSIRCVQVSSRPILRRTVSRQPGPMRSPIRRCRIGSTSMQVG
jgi:hypothetical protein